MPMNKLERDIMERNRNKRETVKLDIIGEDELIKRLDALSEKKESARRGQMPKEPVVQKQKKQRSASVHSIKEHERYIESVSERKRIQRLKQRRRKMRRVIAARCIFAGVCILILFVSIFLIRKAFGLKSEIGSQSVSIIDRVFDRNKMDKIVTKMPPVTVDYLSPNEYSRPQEEIGKVKNIFIHYTANPETTAAQNKSYFENLAVTHETSASSHFVIGYEGEIVQCLPFEEIGYAVKGRNYDSISIECCYLNENGEFTQETYDSLLQMTAWLIGKYNLTPSAVVRHYDEGGKNCPKYYVENEGEWKQFLVDLENYIAVNGEEQ